MLKSPLEQETIDDYKLISISQIKFNTETITISGYGQDANRGWIDLYYMSTNISIKAC